MADEREVSIVIKARNLTAEEFQKAREQLSGLRTKTDEAGKSGETFGQKILGAKNVTDLFSNQVKTLVAGFTIASLLEKAVGSVISWTAGIYENASALVKQHEKTGVSIEMLQRWQKVAKQTDIDQSALTDAAYKFGITMQDGAQSTKDALSRIGLSYDELRKKSPDDQLDLTLKALAGVTDVGERNYIGNELLSKSYAALSPAVSEYEKIVSSVTVASEGQVRALKEQQEAIERQTQSWKDWWTQVFGDWALAREASAKLTSQQQATWQAIVKSGGDGQAYLLKLAQERIAKEKEVSQAAKAAAATQQKITVDFISDLRKSQQEVASLSLAQKAQITAAVQMGASESDIAAKLGVSQNAVKLYKEQLSDNKKRTEEATQAQNAWNKSVKDGADEMSGAKLADEIELTTARFIEATKSKELDAYHTKELVKQIDGFLEKGGKLPPLLADFYFGHKDWNAEITRSYDGMIKLVNSVPNATKSMSDLVIPLKELKSMPIGELLKVGAIDMSKFDVKPPDFKTPLRAAIARGLEYAIDAAAESTTLKSALGVLGSSMADQVGQYFASIEGAGPMTQGFGRALQLAARQPSLSSAVATFAGGMGSTLGGMLGSAVGGPMGKAIGSSLGSLVGPVIKKFFGSAGRDAVKEFAATFGGSNGGFDNLHKKLGELGAQGEQLWIKLTQGVGKNNPQEAAAVIDQITKALDAQAASSEAAAAAFADAQDKIGAALASVTSKVGGQAASYLELRQKVTDAQTAYDDLVRSGAGQDEVAEAAKNLARAQADVFGATITTQAEFDRLSRIALGTFNTLVASGVPPIEAMKRIGSSVDDLMANVKAFGLSGGAAYDQLARWRTLTTDNAPLLEQVGGLNDLMQMTTTLGGMNADAFKDMQTQGLDAYNQLLRAGFTEAEARAQIRPLLENEIKLARDKGYAIDDATQKIIDQARANGELTDESLSTNNILMDGLGAMIKALGGDLPDAWKKSTKAAETESIAAAKAMRDKFAAEAIASVDDVKGAIGGIFDEFSGGIDIPVNFDVNKDGLDGLGGNSGGGSTSNRPAYASGGIAEGRQVALLAERGRREIVGDEAFMARAIKGANDRMGVSSSTTTNQPTTNNYFLLDPSGRSKRLSREQLSDLQRRFDGGEFSIPSNAVMRRTS